MCLCYKKPKQLIEVEKYGPFSSTCVGLQSSSLPPLPFSWKANSSERWVSALSSRSSRRGRTVSQHTREHKHSVCNKKRSLLVPVIALKSQERKILLWVLFRMMCTSEFLWKQLDFDF